MLRRSGDGQSHARQALYSNGWSTESQHASFREDHVAEHVELARLSDWLPGLEHHPLTRHGLESAGTVLLALHLP